MFPLSPLNTMDSPYRQHNSSQSKSLNIHNCLEETVRKKSISDRGLVPGTCGNDLVRESGWGNLINVTYNKKGENLFHIRNLYFIRRCQGSSEESCTCFRKGDLNFSIFFWRNQQKRESQSEVGIQAQLKAEHLTAKNSKDQTGICIFRVNPMVKVSTRA